MTEIAENQTILPDIAGREGGPAGAGVSLRGARSGEAPGFASFIGCAPEMRSVYDKIRRAAKSNAAVFITGESGPGKELCARGVHNNSHRKSGPFVPVNCAAIPRDLMQSEMFGHVKGAFTSAVSDRAGAVSLANGGTLFLDEVAEMPPEMQAKFLRFLQDFTYTRVGSGTVETTDVRIISATNRRPYEEVENGTLREDLLYRRQVLSVSLPPLRERGDDILMLANEFLKQYAHEEKKRFAGFTKSAEDMLLAYAWPGNVRELQNVVRSIVVMNKGDMITEKHLSSVLPPPREKQAEPGEQGGQQEILPLALEEKRIIQRAIRLCGGNIPQAAARLDVSPSTIYRKKSSWDEVGREA